MERELSGLLCCLFAGSLFAAFALGYAFGRGKEDPRDTEPCPPPNEDEATLPSFQMPTPARSPTAEEQRFANMFELAQALDEVPWNAWGGDC